MFLFIFWSVVTMAIREYTLFIYQCINTVMCGCLSRKVVLNSSFIHLSVSLRERTTPCHTFVIWVLIVHYPNLKHGCDIPSQRIQKELYRQRVIPIRRNRDQIIMRFRCCMPGRMSSSSLIKISCL